MYAIRSYYGRIGTVGGVPGSQLPMVVEPPAPHPTVNIMGAGEPVASLDIDKLDARRLCQDRGDGAGGVVAEAELPTHVVAPAVGAAVQADRTGFEVAEP